MNIHEFQAKKLLREYGVRVPGGEVACAPDEAAVAARGLGGDAWMVKAQIHAGGRGRGAIDGGHGGVRTASDVEQARRHAADMLGKTLVTAQTGARGLPVECVYVERKLQVERELALSLLIDGRRRRLTLLLFARGGGGIEADADALRVDIDTAKNDAPNAGELEDAFAKLALRENLQTELREIIGAVIRLFREKDARFIEINPLAVCAGELCALDAKISFDNNALFRQPQVRAFEPGLHRGQKLSSLDSFNYIPLDGDIATLAAGAGLAMATLDALRHYGGAPANFLDLPPNVKVNKVISALEALHARGAKCLLVNVFGGGIMRCDTLSDAILLHRRAQPRMRMSVRLAGTNAELANRRLRESAPEIYLAQDMADAARAAVELAQGAKNEKRAGKRPGLRNMFRRAAAN